MTRSPWFGRSGTGPSPSTTRVLRATCRRIAAVTLSLAFCLHATGAGAASPLVSEASQAYLDGDYQAAVDNVTAAFRAGEVSQQLAPTALVIRAIAQANLGNAEAAWQDIGNAIETSSTEAFVAYGGAEVSRVLGQPDRGLAYADTALRYSPGTPAYLETRAALLRDLGFEDLALRDDERARALLQNDTAWSEEEEARRLCVLGDDQACVQRLIPLMPDKISPGTAAMIGYLAVDLGEAEWGRALIDAAMQEETSAIETWLYAGLLAYRDGDNVTARSDFLNALQRDPRDLRAGLGLLAASPDDRFAALADWRDMLAGLPYEANHDTIFDLSRTTDWPVAADRAWEVFATYDGPFVAVAVALLSEGDLDQDQRRELFGRTATFQRHGHDAFARYLADIERRRLGGL